MGRAETKPDEHAERREALSTLEHLRDQPTFAGSALADAGRRAARHFSGTDPGEVTGAADPIELWGRRIGRALSLVGCIGLAIYLFVTYVR
jgi:hypothetical protein